MCTLHYDHLIKTAPATRPTVHVIIDCVEIEWMQHEVVSVSTCCGEISLRLERVYFVWTWSRESVSVCVCVMGYVFIARDFNVSLMGPFQTRGVLYTYCVSKSFTSKAWHIIYE